MSTTPITPAEQAQIDKIMKALQMVPGAPSSTEVLEGGRKQQAKVEAEALATQQHEAEEYSTTCDMLIKAYRANPAHFNTPLPPPPFKQVVSGILYETTYGPGKELACPVRVLPEIPKPDSHVIIAASDDEPGATVDPSQAFKAIQTLLVMQNGALSSIQDDLKVIRAFLNLKA